jgi:hypothetical protein
MIHGAVARGRCSQVRVMPVLALRTFTVGSEVSDSEPRVISPDALRRQQTGIRPYDVRTSDWRLAVSH